MFMFNSFFQMVRNQFDKVIKVIRTDNDPKFNLVNFYNMHGIIHQRACVETPQQNGIVERKH